ncbi:MAG: acyltransferase [Bacteroidetes bacterium]|nr:acyltransferase [Bacteroidota bacterium]
MTIKNQGSSRHHIQIIELLRGIAALGVVCYHFANSTLPTIKPNPLGSFFEWAKLGIPMFFLISGYVIPLSMHQSGYKIGDAGRFFLKRMIRMIPPAWIAIFLMMGIYFAGYALNGRPIEGMTWPGTSLKSVLANLFFSYKLFDIEKYIEAYWTLEVEFQFYILITFLFPLVVALAKKPVYLSLLLLGISCTYFLYDDRFMFFRDNSFFILGILLFLHKTEQISKNYFLYASFAATVACYMQQGVYGAAGSVMAILSMNYVRLNNPITTFLGMISFSLYITHKVSGVVAEFLLRNLTGFHLSDPIKVLMFFVYIAISIAFAWIFYKLIEAPSMNWSKKIRLKKTIHPVSN